MQEKNEKIYLLQNKHSLLEHAIPLFIIYTLIVLILSMLLWFSNKDLFNLWRVSIAALLILVFAIRDFLVNVIITIENKCFNKVEFDTETKKLIINDIPYKIKRTRLLKMGRRYILSLQGAVLTWNHLFPPGLLTFTLENKESISIILSEKIDFSGNDIKLDSYGFPECFNVTTDTNECHLRVLEIVLLIAVIVAYSILIFCLKSNLFA